MAEDHRIALPLMNLTRRHVLSLLLTAPLAGHARAEGAVELTKARENRLQKYLPKVLVKMQKREPVFAVVCGDEISSFFQPGKPRSDSDHLMAWHSHFLDRLGSPFSYHGGVTDLMASTFPSAPDPKFKERQEAYQLKRLEWEKTKKGPAPVPPGLPQNTSEYGVNDLLRLGTTGVVPINNKNSFFSRNFSTEGALALQALDPLSSLAFNIVPENMPDIVILAYGARDALENASLEAFRKSLEQAVAICRQRGADVLLAGPPPALDEADERSAIGRARPWAAVMREVAEAAGVYFADLGAVAMHRPSDLMNRTPEGAFRSAAESLRPAFHHGAGLQDALHPNAAAHRRMGMLAADWLLDGEPALPWQIVSAEMDLALDPAGGGTLNIRVENRTDEEQTLSVSPLRFTGWVTRPREPDRFYTFRKQSTKDGAVFPRRKFTFVLQPTTTAALPGRNEAPPPHEEFVRGSILVCDDQFQHLVDIKARILPLALLWPEERTDNAASEHLLKCSLLNTGKEDIDATLTLEWLGQKTPLSPVSVAAGESQPLLIKLPLPPVDSAFRFSGEAIIHVTRGTHTWKFQRRIEGIRHTGLNEKLPLVPVAQWRSTPQAPPDPQTIQLTADANLSGLFLTIDVPASITSDDVANRPWGRLEIQIDGRKAGENGTLGCVGTLIVEIPRGDSANPLPLQPVRPAVFGSGYMHPYDETRSFICKAKFQQAGGRRITFNMARSILVHHGWSLDGGGQNDFGFNVRLMLCDGNAGGFTAARTWALAAGSFPAADARSLTVMELRNKPAARWSLRIC